MTGSYIRTPEIREKIRQNSLKQWATPEIKAKIVGPNNSQWKGDQVKYVALHDWVKYYKPKPEVCDKCKQKATVIDLANISGKYKRSLDDFEWLCRRCHMLSDGRMNNLKIYGGNDKRDPKTGRFLKNDS